MSPGRQQTAVEEQEGAPAHYPSAVEEQEEAPGHYPFAPSDELFDITTTVDPSYIISLIRKLLPTDARTSDNTNMHVNQKEEIGSSQFESRFLNSQQSNTETRDTVDVFGQLGHLEVRDEGSFQLSENDSVSVKEDTWEEYGCILWDLAASSTQAEVMVRNLVLEVLLANLLVSQSTRVTEICLGIIGNLACHEISRKYLVSTDGLMETILHQLFLDDTPCLCEVFRLLTLGLQGSERLTWAAVLQSEHIMRRILWIVENTLNPHLLEKSVGLLLAILESRDEVAPILLPSLVKLGLPNLLINLLAFEMDKLKCDRLPERYPVLDIILSAIESLSIIDDYSQEICSNKELFQLIFDLVESPDKVEVANSCVTAAVIISNILTDRPELVSEISQDLSFLEALLDLLPFASEDLESRGAIWSIITRLLMQVNESKMGESSLHQYISLLANKLDLIEEDLLDHQSVDPDKEPGKSNWKATTTALGKIISILTHLSTSKDCAAINHSDSHLYDGNIERLLNCCRKFTKC